MKLGISAVLVAAIMWAALGYATAQQRVCQRGADGTVYCHFVCTNTAGKGCYC